MNFAPCARPKFTSAVTSLPRSSDPKITTRSFSFLSASRIRDRVSRVSCGPMTASAAASLPAQLDGIRIHHIKFGAMQTDVGANLPRQQRMLVSRIVADQQDRGRVENV